MIMVILCVALQAEVVSNQLVHSKFLQHLISLAFGLGIVPVILRERTHLFLKPTFTLDPEWEWLKTCNHCLNVSGSHEEVFQRSSLTECLCTH